MKNALDYLNKDCQANLKDVLLELGLDDITLGCSSPMVTIDFNMY